MADQDSPAQLRSPGAGNGTGSDSGSVARSGTANSAAANGRVVNGRVTNGRAAKRDSDDIVAEIERTRQDLARTIDSLADRVSPAGNARRLRERAAEQMTRPEVQLAALAVVLAATGVAIYRIWGRRRA